MNSALPLFPSLGEKWQSPGPRLKTSVNIKVKDLPVLLPGAEGSGCAFLCSQTRVGSAGGGFAFSRDGCHRSREGGMGMLTQQPPLHSLERRGTAFGASRFAFWGCAERPSPDPPRALIPIQAERCDRNLCLGLAFVMQIAHKSC